MNQEKNRPKVGKCLLLDEVQSYILQIEINKIKNKELGELKESNSHAIARNNL